MIDLGITSSSAYSMSKSILLNTFEPPYQKQSEICENKEVDQFQGNREAADQCLCFHCTDITIPLFLKSKISSFYPSSVTVKAGLCWTWSETQIVGFLT